ncbi:hypothetical protein CF66_3063 [Candidatus Photodesmus katoptron]|uniref:HAD-superfamily hydrolase, subfamily IA n=1 Tax=Candidatus Photodesmus katoptron Akat1 TaxID=1236703 RepID=S3EH48_9GAMM|nr:5-amino-6-(5-phospho-D-ribitylamino)uracil phosphatase YigB [Candidatus Photodesmus katoptron]EPE37508.1 HAD-superfamily hydrolase, subfamily IA [Candidatus Photodesmus katoptron Akat1]KEY90337.1 hypothetical protein CF66_3063 [Candidatus Photodesmus katoptron]
MQFYRHLSEIKAMTFDLDDTLYDNQPIMHQLEKKMLIWLHKKHPISSTQPITWWKQIKYKLLEKKPLLKHDVTLWLFYQIEQGLIQLEYSFSKARKAAKESIEKMLELRSQFKVSYETHQILASLAEKIPIAAITNGNVNVNKIGLSPYFQLVLKAGRDGLAKPYPDMFIQAKQFLKLHSHQILHIGDHLLTDVLGAKKNGFQACWYNNQGKNLIKKSNAKLLPDIEINQLNSVLLLI